MLSGNSISEAARLARLQSVLNSLATRIPQVVLNRVEKTCPCLLKAITVKDAELTPVVSDSKVQVVLHRAEKLYPSLMENLTVTIHTENGKRKTATNIGLQTGNKSQDVTIGDDETDAVGYKCLRCREKFSTIELLTKHYELHEIGRAFVCEICDQGFQKKKFLKEHQKFCSVSVHRIIERREAALQARTQLIKKEEDALSEGEAVKCLRCREKFETSDLLIKHYELHKIGRAFVCEVCDQGFRKRTFLDEHHKVCGSKDYFICKLCNRGFRSLGSFRSHCKQVHTNMNRAFLLKSRPFKCTLCNKVFSNRQSVQCHSCTEDAPYYSGKNYNSKLYCKNNVWLKLQS